MLCCIIFLAVVVSMLGAVVTVVTVPLAAVLYAVYNSGDLLQNAASFQDLFQESFQESSLSGMNVYKRKELSNSIRGTFELHDRLELATVSGAIDVQVNPQPGNGISELVLESMSGNIKLDFGESSESWWTTKNDRSTRTVNIYIKTMSGNVSGRINLGTGSSATVKTTSGRQNLKVNVFEVDGNGGIGRLTTRSMSGNQKIEVKGARGWRGTVHATSIDGKIVVRGDSGMVFDKQGEHEVVAHAGNVADEDIHYVAGTNALSVVPGSHASHDLVNHAAMRPGYNFFNWREVVEFLRALDRL